MTGKGRTENDGRKWKNGHWCQPQTAISPSAKPRRWSAHGSTTTWSARQQLWRRPWHTNRRPWLRRSPLLRRSLQLRQMPQTLITCSYRRHGQDKTVLSCLVLSVSAVWTSYYPRVWLPHAKALVKVPCGHARFCESCARRGVSDTEAGCSMVMSVFA